MAEVMMVEKRGGAGRGQGRPPALQKQIAEAKKLRRALQGAMGLGLKELAEAFPTLLRDEIRSAQEGDEKSRRYLLDLMVKMTKMEGDDEETPIARIFQQFMVKVEEGGKVEIGKDE